MSEQSPSLDELIITIKPEATPEKKERFLNELARIMMAIARHIIERDDSQSEGEPQATEIDH